MKPYNEQMQEHINAALIELLNLEDMQHYEDKKVSKMIDYLQDYNIEKGENKMKKYLVSISEVLVREVEVFAKSEEEAKQIVDSQYINEEIILDESDYNGHTMIEVLTEIK